jgi:hypothetical protein
MMAYQSTVWLGSIAALCPSEDSAGDGTTTLTDFTGVSNGVLTNMDAATDWVTDDGKRCLDFDGSNDHVVTDCTPVGGAKRIAFAVKFRRLATTGNGMFCGIANVLTSTANRLIIYHFSDGNLYCQFDGGNNGYFAFALTDLNWHSLIVHFDGSQTGNENRLKIWLDGVAETLTFIGTIPAQLTTITTGRLWLGVIADSAAIYGRSRIDDVRVSLRLWSDAERAEIDASRGGTYAEASGGTSGFTGLSGVGRLGT